MKDIDGFHDKLDLDPPENVEITYEKAVFNEDKITDADDDYRYLRNKMRKFMASGEFILSKSINALNSDPTPRMIEASSLILRNILKISENLLNLHKDVKVILKKEDEVDKEIKKDDNTLSASLVDIIEGINEIGK